MIHKKILFTLLSISLLCGTFRPTFASHALGMELTYRHLNNQSYAFTAVFYRYCTGATATAPNSLNLLVESVSQGLAKTNIANLPLIPFSPRVVTGLDNCLSVPECFTEYVYRGVVDFATKPPLNNQPASDWVFSVSNCCYPLMSNITGGDIHASCGMNNLDFPNGNDAPFWHSTFPNRPMHLSDTVFNPPVKSICTNRLYTFSQAAVDYQNDSMSYEFIAVESSTGTPTTYKFPYSSTSPMNLITPPGLSIHDSTGVITVMAGVTPPSTLSSERFALAIKATEYRNNSFGVAKEIGYSVRNFTIFVEPIGTCPVDTLLLNNTRQIIDLTCETEITVTTSDYFQCSSVDNDVSFAILTDSATNLPVYIDSVSSLCNNRLLTNQLTLYLLNPLPTGKYFLKLRKGKDGNTFLSECGSDVPGVFNDSIRIHVNQKPISILGSKDSTGAIQSTIITDCGYDSLKIDFSIPILCSSIDTNGTDFWFTNFAGTKSYPIILAKADNCTGNLTSSAILYFNAPLLSDLYKLYLRTGNDGNAVINECNQPSRSTSIEVFIPEENIDFGPDQEFCDSAFSFTLDAGPNGIYLWSDGSNLQTLTVTKAGTYFVVKDNGRGCVVGDTIKFTKLPCPGIFENTNSSIRIYPNPTTDIIYVDYTDAQDQFEIEVINMKGEKIINSYSLSSKHTIDLSGYSRGIYFIKVSRNGTLLKSDKIVLQ